ncbi:MAG: hypothetical protein ABI193_18040 [Minicystis sp.]
MTGDGTKKITFGIDATSQDFNQADAVFCGGQVTTWLKRHKLEK